MTSANSVRRGRLHTASWLLLTVLLGLPFITPLLRWTAVACTHDGHLHYHRVAAMAHAWGNGVYLTRWLPDLAFGYGYPFFVYREPAPLFAVLLPFLAGLPLPAASNLFYAVTILAAGLFMALWVRDVLGPRAAVVSAVAYMSAPYVLIDALVRGNSPESLALPLFPFLLWVGRRWMLDGSVPAFISGVLGLALLSVGHNISTLIFAPTLLVYLVALAIGNRGRQVDDGQQTMDDRRRDNRRQTTDDRRQRATLAVVRGLSSPLLRAFLLVGLGLGVAFFYSGGAVLEMDQVTLEMSTTTRNNDWRFNFATVGEILAPVAPEDPTLVNPPLRFRLGWVPMALAALGATGLLWIRGTDGRAREQRLHIGLMLAGAAVYLFMALPLSRPLWEALPLIDFVQFPWRFVGRAALPVAFLAGVPFVWGDDRRQTTDDGKRGALLSVVRRPSSVVSPSVVRGLRSVVLPGLALALLTIETLPNLFPRYCVEEPFPTILTVHAYERETGLVGVDPEGSYFPRTVRERPTGSPLEADYLAGRDPQRFDAAVLPPGATLDGVAYQPLGATLTVDAPEAFTARYLSFDFPGWSARVDGAAVPITPEDPTGLITFPVPAGRHEVVVAWGPTPLRLALVGLSALASVGVVAVGLWARRRPGIRRRSGRLSHPEGIILALLALALLGITALAGRMDNPLRRTGTPPVAIAGGLTGGALRFDGFNLSRESVPAGETFDVDMAWTAIAPPAVDYQSDLWLAGPDGLMWSVKGTERPRIHEDAPPTRLWSPGEWGWDSREVRVLPGTPPGSYDLVLTLFDRATLQPVTLSGPSGAGGPTATIGRVEVTNPASPPEFTPQYPLDAEVSPGLRLLGYNQDRAEAVPGESVLLTLFWACDAPAACDQFDARLEDETGEPVQTWSLPAIREGFAPEEWPDHGRLRGQHLLRLPAELASGGYRFVLGDGIALAPLQVTAPERQFAPPPLDPALDALFTTADGQPVATLAGLSATTPLCTPAPSRPCAVALVWRAEAETTTDYRVFVHLVDEEGRMIAQSDAAPAGWTRPTTGWLPGEYVSDNHSLALPETLPPGPLSLRVGLYDAANGRRLPAGVGEFVTIPLADTP